MADDRISYELDPVVDEVFDESSGNSFLALRMIKWGSQQNFKLDMRKWFVNSAGDETPGKGVSFMTDSGPTTLIRALIKNDYGDTQEILEELHGREDFIPSLAQTITKTELQELNDLHGQQTDEELFDPREIIKDE